MIQDKKDNRKDILKNPKVVTALSILALILLAGGYYFWKASQFEIYQNKEYSFTVKYPRLWVVSNDAQGAVVSFLSPQEDLDVFRENVNITVEDLGGRKMILREYAAIAVNQLRRVFKDVKVLSSEPSFLSQRAAHKLIYDLEANYPLRIMHLWTFQGDRVYMMTFTAEVDKFDKFMPMVDTMTKSFTLTK